jgi:hypothetical protein
MGRVRAAVWQNEAEGRVFHNITFSRLYKEDDQWKDSGSFGRDDLPLVAKLADLAHTWLYQGGPESLPSDGDDARADRAAG